MSTFGIFLTGLLKFTYFYVLYVAASGSPYINYYAYFTFLCWVARSLILGISEILVFQSVQGSIYNIRLTDNPWLFLRFVLDPLLGLIIIALAHLTCSPHVDDETTGKSKPVWPWRCLCRTCRAYADAQTPTLTLTPIPIPIPIPTLSERPPPTPTPTPTPAARVLSSSSSRLPSIQPSRCWKGRFLAYLQDDIRGLEYMLLLLIVYVVLGTLFTLWRVCNWLWLMVWNFAALELRYRYLLEHARQQEADNLDKAIEVLVGPDFNLYAMEEVSVSVIFVICLMLGLGVAVRLARISLKQRDALLRDIVPGKVADALVLQYANKQAAGMRESRHPSPFALTAARRPTGRGRPRTTGTTTTATPSSPSTTTTTTTTSTSISTYASPTLTSSKKKRLSFFQRWRNGRRTSRRESLPSPSVTYSNPVGRARTCVDLPAPPGSSSREGGDTTPRPPTADATANANANATAGHREGDGAQQHPPSSYPLRSRDKWVPPHPPTTGAAGGLVFFHEYERVAMMFSDLVGFTTLASKLHPEHTFRVLDTMFRELDHISTKLGCWKYETVGDAYITASNLIHDDPQPEITALRMGLALIAVASSVVVPVLGEPEPTRLQARVGLHVGRVAGGVVGAKRQVLQLVGDTLNTASRMESNSVPSCVTASATFWERLPEPVRALFVARTVDVKGKGPMVTYLLDVLEKQDEIGGLGLEVVGARRERGRTSRGHPRAPSVLVEKKVVSIN